MKTRRSIFVAYPYGVFPKDDYRRVFTVVEKNFDVAFVFADSKVTNSHIFDKITEQIRESVFGIKSWRSGVLGSVRIRCCRHHNQGT